MPTIQYEDPEPVLRTFRYWLRNGWEPNPRYATLVVWLELNFPQWVPRAEELWQKV